MVGLIQWISILMAGMFMWSEVTEVHTELNRYNMFMALGFMIIVHAMNGIKIDNESNKKANIQSVFKYSIGNLAFLILVSGMAFHMLVAPFVYSLKDGKTLLGICIATFVILGYDSLDKRPKTNTEETK